MGRKMGTRGCRLESEAILGLLVNILRLGLWSRESFQLRSFLHWSSLPRSSGHDRCCGSLGQFQLGLRLLSSVLRIFHMFLEFRIHQILGAVNRIQDYRSFEEVVGMTRVGGEDSGSWEGMGWSWSWRSWTWSADIQEERLIQETRYIH